MSFQYPTHLMQEVDLARSQWQMILDSWQVKEKAIWKETNIYSIFPFLFQEAFPAIPQEKYRALALAGLLLSDVIFLTDEIVDCHKQAAIGPLFYLLAINHDAYMIFQELFPPSSPFFTKLKGRFLDYFQSCSEEKQFASGALPWEHFDEARALTIAAGKAGMARTILDALGELSGDPASADCLIESTMAFYQARQLYDDVLDWKQDLTDGTPTLLLASAFPDGMPRNPAKELIEKTAARLYGEGHMCHVLRIARDHTEKAKASLARFPDSLTWKLVILDVQDRCQRLLAEMEGIIKGNGQASSRSLPPAPLVGCHS